MEYVICYDIPDDARRSRLADALLDFGKRIQRSVFLAHLDGDLAARMDARIRSICSATEDSVVVLPLCAACTQKMRPFGIVEIPEDRPWYII